MKFSSLITFFLPLSLTLCTFNVDAQLCQEDQPGWNALAIPFKYSRQDEKKYIHHKTQNYYQSLRSEKLPAELVEIFGTEEQQNILVCVNFSSEVLGEVGEANFTALQLAFVKVRCETELHKYPGEQRFNLGPLSTGRNSHCGGRTGSTGCYHIRICLEYGANTPHFNHLGI